MANYPNPSQMMKSIEQVIANNLNINMRLIGAYMSVDPDNGGLILTATAYGKSFISISFGMETDLDGLTELVEAELGIQKLLGTIPTEPNTLPMSMGS